MAKAKRTSREMPKPRQCAFCGKPPGAVTRMIAGIDAGICEHCVEVCHKLLMHTPQPHRLKAVKPVEIKEQLDEYVVGQEKAKKTISVAVHNHLKRILHGGTETGVELEKSNILLIGPTGSGKTLIAKTLARILNVPFSISDATTLTEAGYVGEDVENVLLRLLQAADFDVAWAENGIIYIDEIDKIHRTTGNVSITRDVSGEGVQQAFLKIIEGTIANIPPKGGRKHPQQEYINMDSSNILFLCGGAFNGLEEIIARRVGHRRVGFNIEPTQRRKELLPLVQPEDLIEYGMIPEFVGRLAGIATLSALTEEELATILTTPRNALVKQYTRLLSMEGVELAFTDEALRECARIAVEKGTGARALRLLLEEIMLDVMYEVPSRSGLARCIITEEVIRGTGKPEMEYLNKEKKIA